MACVRSMAVGSVAVDCRPSPYLCVDGLSYAHSCSSSRVSSSACGRRSSSTGVSTLELSSSFVDAWRGRRPAAILRKQQRRRRRRMVVVDELGGQYEEGFDDVDKQLINYFTYKATRTVLHQLYEMNPPNYMWFYNFVATNSPADGKQFLRLLGKEKQDLAERVMVTRLHLYAKWIKKCDHAKMYQQISDENLELMRQRLQETVIWPSDDTNMERVG